MGYNNSKSMDMTDLHQAGVPSSKANEDGSQTIPYPAVHTQIAGIYIYNIISTKSQFLCRRRRRGTKNHERK